MSVSKSKPLFFPPLVEDPREFTQYFESADFVPPDLRELTPREDNKAKSLVLGDAGLTQQVKDYLAYDTIEPSLGVLLLAGLVAESPPILGEQQSLSEYIELISKEYDAALALASPDLLEGFYSDDGQGAPWPILTKISRLDGLSWDWFHSYLFNWAVHPHWWNVSEGDYGLGHRSTQQQWQLRHKILSEISARLKNSIRFAKIWESGDHPDKPSLKYLKKWAKDKDIQPGWITLLPKKPSINSKRGEAPKTNKERTKILSPKKPSINTRRAEVLKAWMNKDRTKIGDTIDKSRAEVWEELMRMDTDDLFKSPAKDYGLKGGSLSSTPRKFFSWAVKQHICRFK